MRMISKDRREQVKLARLIGEIKRLYDQGITNPDEIAAKVKQPDYVVIDCLELMEKLKRANQN